jgi:hypothetical protein
MDAFSKNEGVAGDVKTPQQQKEELETNLNYMLEQLTILLNEVLGKLASIRAGNEHAESLVGLLGRIAYDARDLKENILASEKLRGEVASDFE